MNSTPETPATEPEALDEERAVREIALQLEDAVSIADHRVSTLDQLTEMVVQLREELCPRPEYWLTQGPWYASDTAEIRPGEQPTRTVSVGPSALRTLRRCSSTLDDLTSALDAVRAAWVRALDEALVDAPDYGAAPIRRHLQQRYSTPAAPLVPDEDTPARVVAQQSRVLPTVLAAIGDVPIVGVEFSSPCFDDATLAVHLRNLDGVQAIAGRLGLDDHVTGGLENGSVRHGWRGQVDDVPVEVFSFDRSGVAS